MGFGRIGGIAQGGGMFQGKVGGDPGHHAAQDEKQEYGCAGHENQPFPRLPADRPDGIGTGLLEEKVGGQDPTTAGQKVQPDGQGDFPIGRGHADNPR
jgi:hypothetical protein